MAGRTVIADFEGAGLRPIFGTPAARRLALVARRCGFDNVSVVGRDDGLAGVLHDIVPGDAFVKVDGEADLGSAVCEPGVDAGERVLVMAAGAVIDAWSVKKLISAGAGPSDVYAAGDRDALSVCLVTPRCVPDILKVLRAPGSSLPAGISCERVSVAAGLPVIPRNAKEAADAGRALVAAVGASTAQTDSFFSKKIHRPLSRPISSRLANTFVTPNMFTLFHIAVGLAGAFFLLKGTYPSQVAGGLLFLASTILDGVDGELARLKLQESNFGHYLDIVGDNVVHVAVFLGMALGLYYRSDNPVYLWALAFLLVGFGLCAISVQLDMGHGPGEQASSESNWLASLTVNRDFAWLVVVLALVNKLSWFVFGTTAGVYAFALVLFVLSRKKKARTRASFASGGNSTRL